MPISSDSAPGERERHPAVLRLDGVAAGYGGAAIVSGAGLYFHAYPRGGDEKWMQMVPADLLWLTVPALVAAVGR